MQFSIKKTELLRGLRLANAIAEGNTGKSIMPILTSVLLRVQGKDKLLLAGTDLNTSLTAELESVNITEGGVTVNSKKFLEIISKVPVDNISIKKLDNQWVEIVSGKSKVKIAGLSDREFPKMPDHCGIEYSTIDSTVFRNMINKTAFAVCDDEFRPHLNAIYFECDGKSGQMVATDGHRLSKVRCPLAGPVLKSGIIIPKKVFDYVTKICNLSPQARLAVSMPYLYLIQDGLVLASKLIDATFPPYEQVIPQKHLNSIFVNRIEFLNLIKRAQVVATDMRGIKLGFENNTLTVTCDNPSLGGTYEDMEIQYLGPKITVGFNPYLISELLNHMDSNEVNLLLNGDLDPAVIRPSNEDTNSSYLGLIMPMRLT